MNSIPIRRPFVLSGGGARGYAHLGVLKAFAEHGISPEVISATSAGSIAAAFICDGYSTEEVREIFKLNKLGLSMQWRNWRSGFLSLKKVEQVLKKTLRHTTFESMPVPLFITATNFVTGAQGIFDKGDIIPAVLAASSIPLLFQPVMIDDVPYVDGGLSGNLPVEPLVGEYKEVIGVHVNPLTPYNPAGGFLANMDRTLNMAISAAVLKDKLLCSRFVEPEGLGQFGMFEFNRLEQIYTIGLQYTRNLLEEHPEK
jgi:NTE family protein